MEKTMSYDDRILMDLVAKTLEKEYQKTDEMSQKLVDIGEVTALMSKNTIESHQSIEENSNMLDAIVKGQRSLLMELQSITDALTQNRIKDGHIEQLRQHFDETLKRIIDEHNGDVDALVQKVANIYRGYTTTIERLSQNIEALNVSLSSDATKQAVDQLRQQLEVFDGNLVRLMDEQKIIHNEQTKQSQSILDALSDVSDMVNSVRQESLADSEEVSKIVGLVNVLTTRLDVLIRLSEETSEEVI